MIDVISVYEDAARDNASKEENGNLNYERFNRLSRRAELRLIDWLSGDVAGIQPPEPYLTQKNKDWLAPFITKKPANISDGILVKPSDYYLFEHAYILGTKVDEPEKCNTPIDLLDSRQFDDRCKTNIEDLQPSINKPISKIVGNNYEFKPKDLGSIVLEYIRYPKFAEIKTKDDTVYNDVIADPVTSVNYEWGEYARELLIWFITDTFAIHTREQALKQFNADTGKTVRK